MSDAGYEDVYQDWLRRPEDFWARAASNVAWFKLWDRVFDPYMGQYGRWFPGGETNVAYNCLDRHILAGHGHATALISDGISAASGVDKRAHSYDELAEDVAALSGVLVDRGVTAGDRVLVHLPMSAEAVIGMLACARIGAVHCVAGVELDAQALAARIDQITPAAILSSSGSHQDGQWSPIKPALDLGLSSAQHKPHTNIVIASPGGEASFTSGLDISWADAVGEAKKRGRAAACVALPSTAPLYILYAEGSSGASEPIVRDTGGAMTVLRWTFEHIFGASGVDTFWSASNLDTSEGHSYACYGPLLVGGTSVIGAAGAGDSASVSRVLKDHGVSSLHAPIAWFDRLRSSGGADQIATAGLEVVFVSGAQFDANLVGWAQSAFNVPVISQLSSPLAGGVYAVSPSGLGLPSDQPDRNAVPVPGYQLAAMNSAGQPLAAGASGDVVIKLPLPPSGATTLWNGDDDFRARYVSAFPGFLTTGLVGAASGNGRVLLSDVRESIAAQVTVPAALVSVPTSPAVDDVPVLLSPAARRYRQSLGCYGGGHAGRALEPVQVRSTPAAAPGPAPATVRFVAPKLLAGPAASLRPSLGCYGGGHSGRAVRLDGAGQGGWVSSGPTAQRPQPRQSVGCYGGGLSGRRPAFGYAPVFSARQSTGCYGGGTSGRLTPGQKSYPSIGVCRQSVGCYGGSHAGRA